MPATVGHVLTATTPDDPSYEIRPSHWNSAHAVSLNISATEISGLFSNANGVSFGLSGTAITASLAPGGAAGSVSAGTTNVALGQVVFSNASGVSFGLNGSTLTASVKTDYLTTAMQSNAATISNIKVSAGTKSALRSDFTFADSNGLSFGLDAAGVFTGTVKTDYQSSNANYLTSQSSQIVSGANGSYAFQTLSFSNANGVSFGTSAGSAITASHNAITTARASNDGVGLNTAQSNVTWTVNSSGISLDARGYAGTGTTFNGANISGSMTVNSNGVQLSLSGGAGGGVTPVASASNGSFSFTTLAFSNANNVTFGTSAGSIITASVAAPGAAAENNWFALTGNTAGNTTASGSTIALSAGNNITISGTNNSVIRIDAPASSSLVAVSGLSISTNGSTISIGEIQASFFRNGQAITTLGTAQGNSLVSIQPFQVQRDVVFSNVLMAGSFNVGSAANASSAYLDYTASVVFYSRNGSTLSSYGSAGGTGTQSWNSNVTGSVTGVIGLTATCAQTTLTEGEYWAAFHVSTNNTATGGANTTALGATCTMILSNNIASAAQGIKVWGAQTANSMGLMGGMGMISTGATRATIAVSDITVTGTRALLAPIYFEIRNGTYQI